ncbi:uncharacterized protein PHACADRAFT_253175 [Phanerochaete carnosa HHB-10118-sp]|uniref:tripeptidyl-peptidase II n=1 Tax=Phanerochaete carnosa (strain HHB-10118-sp) TaxID=650164 RepID=K5WH80_PHACS|nr:uncharacterized protein PHACADRAFT_253175 [Phanerochaete carnosa HHB-10118-sp]EKM58690.1 hypothetical protein PHACADRAFT_253175 [Phanerochaete carnosa HHB-10118-sp]
MASNLKLLVCFALFLLAFANPMACRTKIHEAIESIPAGYVRVGSALSDTELKLRIALAQRDPEGLIDALYDVSMPGSLSYGKHLSKEEVEQFVTPTAQTSDVVNAWLSQAGVNATSISPAGDWLSITVPVGQANELFNADFAVYTHSNTGKQTIRTTSYSIPVELEGHLDFVYPTITFPNPISPRPVVSTPFALKRRGVNPPAPCSTLAVTPTCVEFLYDIPATKANQSSNKLAVSGFDNLFANRADLQLFLEEFQPKLAGETFSVETIDGGRNSQNRSEAGVEANLDIQYAISTSHGVPATFISVGEENLDGDLSGFLDIINLLLGKSNPPQVLTTSYGDNESETPRPLFAKLCNAYAQLGARGTSILFASGDGGVSGYQHGLPPDSCTDFVPTFPSGCPFVTIVGGTQVVSSNGGETAGGFSSGGFSNYSSRPPYQAAAVESYLFSIGSMNRGLFNASGRGYPDVAAVGINVTIVVNGTVQTINGTSCASPIFAGMVALINDALIAANKSTLGFLNPFLYKHPHAFHDITTGSNPGCNTNGFPALEGWDPVTGLGTPDFVALQAAALKAAGVSYTYPTQMEDTAQNVLSA